MQANHRDRPDAVPLAALHEALGLDGLALIESVATEGQGIREAFVLAVRLALDRARELRSQGVLPVGPGETDDPGALLAWLQIAERETASGTERAERVAEVAADASQTGLQTPRLPDSSVPSGRVWPPIEGRIFLHSASVKSVTFFRKLTPALLIRMWVLPKRPITAFSNANTSASTVTSV